jgi:hypothetical protein
MCNPRLVLGTHDRIRRCDYEAVFTGGCCFHFALRLHKRFDYVIRGIREGCDGKTFSHVWCRKTGDSKGVDIRGVYSEDLLIGLAGGEPERACDVSVQQIENIIRAREYPPQLETEIFELADWIVDNHERFVTARPSNPESHARFVKDIEPESDGKVSG